MSIQLILTLLGCVTVVLLVEDLWDAVWNALVVKRRKADEEVRLQRIERIIEDAKATGTRVAVDELPL